MVARDAGQRFLIVLGIPTGGTSAVAGVLAKLGVDMGNVEMGLKGAQGQARPYDTWEDGSLRQLCLRGGRRPIECEEFVNYVAARKLEGPRRHREPWGDVMSWPISGVVGAKHPHVCTLARFPMNHIRRVFANVEIVHVHRPLEHAINMDSRYFARRPLRKGFLERMYFQLHRILDIVPARMTVSYNMLTNAPEMVVPWIAEGLELGTKPDLISEAVQSIKPNLNHARASHG